MDSDKLTFREGYQLAHLHLLRAFAVLFALGTTGIFATNIFDAISSGRPTELFPSILWLPVFYGVAYGFFRVSNWMLRKTREDIAAQQSSPPS